MVQVQVQVYQVYVYCMVGYTNTEYTDDMVLVYGQAAGNGRAANRIYQKRYRYRATPSHTPFARVKQGLRERGTFTVNRVVCGAPRRRRTLNIEEDVTYCIALKRPRQRVFEPLRVKWVGMRMGGST